MKKFVFAVLIAILTCSLMFTMQNNFQAMSKKNVASEDVYQEVIGFSKTDKAKVPVKENILRFKNAREWGNFVKRHLKNLPIPNIDFKGKYIIFLKVDWNGKDPTQGNKYAVSNISLINKTLCITVKKLNNYMDVDPISPDYKFSYVIITSIGNNGIPQNAKVTLKIMK
jgi:hypothetical protein